MINSVEKIKSTISILPQDLMNNSALKYTKVIASKGFFAVLYNIIQENIAATMGTIGQKNRTPLVTTDTSTHHNRPAFLKQRK